MARGSVQQSAGVDQHGRVAGSTLSARAIGSMVCMVLLMAAVVGGVVGGMGGCDRLRGGKKDAAPPAVPTPEVQVLTVKKQTVPVSFEFVGQTQASRTVEIRARVQGFLQSKSFVEGSLVDEGQTLYQIDQRSFRADVEIAKAQLQRSQARLANAQRQVQRLTDLTRQGAASPKELDDWTTEELQSRADVRLGEAQVANAELNLGYANIVSPVRGRVGRTMKDEGALVDNGPNSLLTTVFQVDPMYVVFSIPEREWLNWRSEVISGRIRHPSIKSTLTPGDAASGRIPTPQADPIPVEVVLLDGTTFQTKGVLDFFDATVNAQTGSAVARGSFENKATGPIGRDGDDQLKPGQFVRIRILGWERPGAMTVPQRAVLQTPHGPIVMVVGADETVNVRPVQTGSWFEQTWIINSGLREGDRVIVEGFMKAPPGTKVKVTEWQPSTGPSVPVGPKTDKKASQDSSKAQRTAAQAARTESWHISRHLCCGERAAC